MCGYLCTGCGKCGTTKPRVKPFGTCLKCGHANEPGTERCTECGAALVLPPGQHAAKK